ncbi:MAG: PcfJ domain-containing protein [Chitinophagales bacterium]
MANRQKRRLVAERIAAKEAQLQQALHLSNRKKRLKKNPLKVLNCLQKVGFKYCKLSKLEQTDLAFLLANFAENNSRRNHCPFSKTYSFLRHIIRKNVLHLLTKADDRDRESLRIVLEYRQEWVRPLEDWQAPKNKQFEPVFAHLIRHLFTHYPVPRFLDEAWHSWHAGAHSGYDTKKQFRRCNEHFIHWFLHVGKGYNIRTAHFLPVRLTKKMAHYLLQSHEHIYIAEAFRRAQVLAMGGTKKQAGLIIRTQLGNSLEHDDFWQQVVRFLLRYPELTLKDMKQIVDFIHHQKFEIPWLNDAEGQDVKLPPIQANWQIKGKTLASVRREMKRWQQIPDSHFQNIENFNWKPFPIADWEFVADGAAYHIQQITQLHDLYREGIAMNHCVGTYAYNCQHGESSIWSLWEEKVGGSRKRLVTIEVGNNRQLKEWKRKNNTEPTKLEKGLIRHWAKLVNVRYMKV